ncbi:MAG: GEVED domain-containing protein [Saprospiraceae bacterium]
MQKFFTCLLILFSWIANSTAQVNYTAQDDIPAYDGVFRPGVNTGYFPMWSNEELGDLIAGNPDKGVKGVGGKVTRPVLAERILEQYGYDVVLDEFEYWKDLGMDEFTVTLTGPAEWHRDLTEYCPGQTSELFRNLYEPIWDNGENGTPYNDDNYFAAYVYKTVSIYNPYVRFWEIWNEPGNDKANKGWREPGDPFGNWWDNDPEPCDYELKAPIEHYVRTLRIAYEIIETIAPEDYVTVAGFGYQSFLDAVLRNTDNPDDGSVTAEYPKNGGAYIEVHGLHSYPHFDGTTSLGNINFYERHSDRAAQGLVYRRDFFQEIYDNYDYDGVTYPKKQTIATEMNVPREFSGGSNFFASTLGQRNYIMKCFVTAITNDVHQFHVYGLSENPGSGSGFDKMGLYTDDLDEVGPFDQERSEEATAMKTTSDMLWETNYDEIKTAQLNVPSGVEAHAFLRADGTYVYMLWAKTMTDLSEEAEGNFSFPTSFGYDQLDRYEWDFSDSGNISNNSSTNIELDATPIFLVEQSASGTSLTIECPTDITVAASDPSGAIVNWSTPTVSTNCNTGTFNLSQTNGPANGSLFSVGTTQVTYLATNTCGQQSSCSFLVIVTEGASGSYCEATSEAPWNEWIAGVQIANINNPSGKCDTECGYGDFTNLTANLSAGQSTPIILTPGLSWSGQSANLYWRIWIDLNQDGDFEDAGEMVLETDGSNQIVNASINIPASTEEGITAMRIAAKKGSYATPCETFEEGEVEDYSVNISEGGGPGCTIGGPCDDNDNCTENDIYDADCNCVGTYQDEDNDGVCDDEDLCPGLDDADPDCINGGPTGDYCLPSADKPWSEWIAAIEVANINNPSGKCDTECGYGDFTNLVANLNSGQTSTIRLTPGLSWPGRDADFYWRVWIDLNQDGDFTDAGEMILEAPGSNQLVVGLLNIPSTADSGITRMRISAKSGAYADPCESFERGEIEDYSVNIDGGGPGPTGDYCDVAAEKPWQEWIAGVTLMDIDNSSGKCDTECGYGDFTNLSTTLLAGESYNITLTPGLSWSGHNADLYWTAWIDFNNDGDFEDNGEVVFQSYGSNQIATGEITIPESANNASTRIRIAAKRGTYASPCENFERGEVEDYSVEIEGSANINSQFLENEKQARRLHVFPNPMSGEYLNVDMTGFEGEAVKLQLSNALGQIITEWNIEEVNKTVMQWQTGILESGAYHITLSSKDSRRKFAQLMVISSK